jgi:hypothetical protein
MNANDIQSIFNDILAILIGITAVVLVLFFPLSHLLHAEPEPSRPRAEPGWQQGTKSRPNCGSSIAI